MYPISSVFRYHELVAWCCAPFFQSGKHDDTQRWDCLSQVRDSPVWITIRDFLLPPDMLAMRTAGPKWNHAKLYGFFAALWFFLMENGEDQKRESESLPEWSSPCGGLRQQFDCYESEIWPLDDD